MEYSLLTIVDDKDLAIRISDYLKLNNVDSYAAQSNKSDSGQWGVYIDGHNAEIAQDLLDSYTDTNNADSHSHAIYPSRRYSLGGSSHSWGYYLLLFLVVGCVRFHFKHKDGAVSFHRAQYKPTVTVPRYSPADIDDAVNRMKKDKDSISENAVVDDHPKITIKDIKRL